MNKKYLIKLLEPYPDDQRIVVDGYEGGYDDPKVKQSTVYKDNHDKSYCGQYQDATYASDNPPLINVVIISRYKDQT